MCLLRIRLCAACSHIPSLNAYGRFRRRLRCHPDQRGAVAELSSEPRLLERSCLGKHRWMAEWLAGWMRGFYRTVMARGPHTHIHSCTHAEVPKRETPFFPAEGCPLFSMTK